MILSRVELPMMPTTNTRHDTTVLMYLKVSRISVGPVHIGGSRRRGMLMLGLTRPFMSLSTSPGFCVALGKSTVDLSFCSCCPLAAGTWPARKTSAKHTSWVFILEFAWKYGFYPQEILNKRMWCETVELFIHHTVYRDITVSCCNPWCLTH